MKNKILSIIIIFLNTFIIYCQNKDLTILDQKTNNCISNVQIFHNGELIGKTNKNGIVQINVNTGEIQIVKEGYTDITIENKNINKIIFLQEIQEKFIEEILVKKLKNSEILDSIYKKINLKGFYQFPNYFHVHNLLKSKNDTLHFINDRFLFKENIGFFINQKNNIIKNFCENKFSKDGFELIYTINKNNFVLKNATALGYFKIDQYREFTFLYENINKYNLSIIKNDEYSKLIFNPKDKKSKFSYEGYIIYNNDDFGIIEFDLNLNYNKKNKIDSYFFKEKIQQAYLINKENFNIKYSKKGNLYEFVSAKNNYNLTQIKGKLKKYIFNNTNSTEATSQFNLNNYNKINIINLNLK